MNKLLLLFVYAILLSACASSPYNGSDKPQIKVSEASVDLSDSDKVKQILNQQYKDWRHVRHSMGGMSKKGIDCSGLVYQTYKTKFGVDIPRSTEHQSKVGQKIKQQQLRAGDLVFFKTGIFKRHVGLYINDGEFLHVSSSKGVMISNLEDPYWNSAYWKAQRVQ